MHDTSPGGLAVKDRAMAYWTDPTNFDNIKERTRQLPATKRAALGFVAGLIVTTLIGA